jgi:hypothetical protein
MPAENTCISKIFIAWPVVASNLIVLASQAHEFDGGILTCIEDGDCEGLAVKGLMVGEELGKNVGNFDGLDVIG